MPSPRSPGALRVPHSLHPSSPAPSRRRFLRAAAAGLALSAAWPLAGAAPASAVPWQRVRFVRGRSARTLSGRLSTPSRVARDFVLHGRTGQALDVQLDTGSPGAAFQVFAPGQTQPLFMSEFSAAPHWHDRLPANGDYRVRVSLNPVQRHHGADLRFTLRLVLAD